MKTPKIGEQMEFVRSVRKRGTVELTTGTGTVRKLRTVRQAFVVDNRNRGQWVDFDILDEQSNSVLGQSGPKASEAME